MKRFKLFFLAFMLLSILTGCNRMEADLDLKEPVTPPALSVAKNSTDIPNTPEPNVATNDGLILPQIRKAAEKAGYNISDDYQAAFMKEVVDGFAVRIVADNEDCIYSIIECKTEDAAVQNARDIDDAGYNISLRSGKILTCFGVAKKGGTIRGILTSIIEGNPLPYHEPVDSETPEVSDASGVSDSTDASNASVMGT